MSVIADLHIHSRFSRATSKQLTPRHLAAWAQCKGINILGTGDFTHPQWRQELKEQLLFDEESGFYKLNVPHETLDFMHDGSRNEQSTPLCRRWKMRKSSPNVWRILAISPPMAAPFSDLTLTTFWRLFWRHLLTPLLFPPISGRRGFLFLVQNLDLIP